MQSLEQQKRDKEIRLTLLYIAMAYVFSIAMRLIWVYNFNDYTPFMWHDQFMINTNDGYFWAEGARDLVKAQTLNPDAKEYLDRFHQAHDLSPTTTATAILTAFFVKILPFSFETIIFYLPAFLSALVVVPIILIAKKLNNIHMGLIAALLASVAWSYYNRTMVGYYDTDMLNIVLPMLLLWSIIWAIDTKQNRYVLFTALDILLYRWWYPQSYALEFSLFALVLAYTLIFDRKNLYNYKLMIIMLFAMMNMDGLVRLGVVVALFILFSKKRLSQKAIFVLLGFATLAFLVSGGFDPIWVKLKAYVFRNSVIAGEEGLNLHFFSVMQTVSEAGSIPFEIFANRISGHTSIFFLSLVGYGYLLYKHRIMLFSLPMVGLGFLAYVGGLRFTIYAVPILALGMAFLITSIAKLIPDKRISVLFMALATLAILFPNYKHIQAYKVPTVFSQDEVAILSKLGKIAKREDYVLAWWDYGYPIRYYADVKTLVDGGKHSGEVNFPVSFVLTHPQKEAALMARLDVEYTEKTFAFADAHKKEIEDKNITLFSTIEQMTKAYGFKDTNDFLEALEEGVDLPKKTRDVYIYLPLRMMNIYTTVAKFSYIDLMNGQKKPFEPLYVMRAVQDNGRYLSFNNGIILDKSTMSLKIGPNTKKLRRFVKASLDRSMKVHTQEHYFDFKSNLTLLYLASYKIFLLMDEAAYHSLYIEVMFLGKYDPNYFEMIIDTPRVKVLKLKL